ncbi:MAG: serine/threonine protein kinase [Myxococcales bacterium]|nr:serine/threonine protein kinase [Myxococcales bacterium]
MVFATKPAPSFVLPTRGGPSTPGVMPSRSQAFASAGGAAAPTRQVGGQPVGSLLASLAIDDEPTGLVSLPTAVAAPAEVAAPTAAPAAAPTKLAEMASPAAAPAEVVTPAREPVAVGSPMLPDDAPTLMFNSPSIEELAVDEDEDESPATEVVAGASLERGLEEDPLIGTVIDERYRLEEMLGSGAMSRVYRATHVRSGGPLAVKIVELHLSHRPETVKRSVQEVRAMMEIQSNHVVRALDVGTFPTGQLYVVMELLVGETLEELLEREGPLPWERVGLMALQICSGLTAGHRRGIFHRDIKPQNCMRVDLDDNEDHIKLIDFGLARDVNVEAGVTQEGIILGTPEYMAPELIASRATPDARSDVYALGATMYKLLTGEAVFHEKNALDTLFQHKHAAPRRPSEAASHLGIPEAADAIVMRALAKDPAQRFATAEDMGQRLRAALGRPRNTLLGEISSSSTPVSALRQTPPPTDDEPARTHERTTPAPVEPARTITPAPADLEAAATGARERTDGGERAVTSAPAPAAVAVAAADVATPRARARSSASLRAARLAARRAEEVDEVEETSARPFPWQRAALGLVAVVAAVVLFVRFTAPPADDPASATGVAEAGPAAGEAKGEPTKAGPLAAGASAADVDPRPGPGDDEGADEPEAPAGEVPAASAKKRPEPGFDYRSARKYVEEQHAFLRATCMKKGPKPLAALKFRVEVKPGGRARVEMPGDAKVRACVRSALAFMFDASPKGGAFLYTLTATSSKLDRKPL